MLHVLPARLRLAVKFLLAGMLGFCLVLMVDTPLAYMATLGLGCLGVAAGSLLYLSYLLGQLREKGASDPVVGESTGQL